jgi:uncharacterized membrane protein
MVLNRMLLATGIGMVAGMRTFTAPAATYRRAEPSSRAIAGALTTLAALEMIADKRTNIPRVRSGALAARVASGAWSAGALASRSDERPLGYAALGGLSAAAGAYGFFLLRRELGRRLGIPDGWLGLAEDLMAITAAGFYSSRR